MNIECIVEKLKNAVALADRMTGKNLTLPSLHSLLLTASGKSLKVRATNLNVGIEIEIPATVTGEGSILVKGDVIANVCSHLEGGESATLEVVNENLSVKTKKTKTLIKCLPNEEFPTLRLLKESHLRLMREYSLKGFDRFIFVQQRPILNLKSQVFLFITKRGLCDLSQLIHSVSQKRNVK